MSVRRQILVDAAHEVCLRDGVHAATTRAIAAEAAMPLASVHYAFSSREQLIEAVIGKRVERFTLDRFKDPTTPTTPEELVTGLVEHLVEHTIAHPIESLLRLELVNHSLRCNSRPGRQHETILHEVIDVLRLVEAAGYRWDVPVGHVAWQIVALHDAVSQSFPVMRDAEAVRRLARVTAPAIAAQASKEPAEERAG